jgi:nuclear GTP-binding protein
VIEASDVLLEVLDARDPLGCRCPQVEEAIVQSEHKKLVLVLNKSGEQKGFPFVFSMN